MQTSWVMYQIRCVVNCVSRCFIRDGGQILALGEQTTVQTTFSCCISDDVVVSVKGKVPLQLVRDAESATHKAGQ
jgi:hypothetical protein